MSSLQEHIERDERARTAVELVHTFSGSIYAFNRDRSLVRRLLDLSGDPYGSLRRDNEWLKVLGEPNIKVGSPMMLLLQPLGEGDVTTRLTSAVTKIWSGGFIKQLQEPARSALEDADLLDTLRNHNVIVGLD